MTYKFLEHESDLYIQGCGADVYAAMDEIADALVHVLNERKQDVHKDDAGRKRRVLTLMVSRNAEDELIVDTFSEIISEIEAEYVQPDKIHITRASIPNTAKVVIEGTQSPPANIVKAVTWHNLEIKNVGGTVCVRVLFDI